MTEDWEAGGFGLYIHWPFCQAKCPYCDFNSFVSAGIDHDRWTSAYLAEIDRVGRETPGRRLSSVFFGGGTPSLMDPRSVARLLDRVAATWDLGPEIEVTLEANPTSVETGRLAAFRSAGINRVSIGVQALDDSALRTLGRLHDAREAMAAIEAARALFRRVSVDLIYARQDQTMAEWRRELASVLSLGLDHLSLYQLTIEPGTAFGDRHARGRLPGLPDEDLSADLYDLTQAMTNAAGYRSYEVSNHARDGGESRHNLIYWRGGDYAGIGPGAHGRLTLGGTRVATETILRPGAWLEGVEAGSGEARREALDAVSHATEYLMMALRLTEGVDLARLRRIAPNLVSSSEINRLKETGLVRTDHGRLRATAPGRLVLNSVTGALLTQVEAVG